MKQGIYLHIPFCKSRCSYCAFYSTTDLAWRQRYVDALCREMQIRQEQQEAAAAGGGRTQAATVYLGGGTPSQLTPQQLEQLFLYINKVYGPLTPEVEVTIEANPDDVDEDFAQLLHRLPVNRVSMGVQTFNDARLRWLNRRHSSSGVERAVRLLREAGIGNISLDLIYGFPDETSEEWLHDIDRALALEPEHVSAYCLSYEEGTPLYRQMEQGRCQPLDEETERAMYYAMKDRLEAAGFEHYEISNFAKPGRRSRHNSSYWTGVPYVGLGAAAHSFDGDCRSWNVSNLRQYVEATERGLRCCETEVLEGDTRYNDWLTVALRTAEGLDLDSLDAAHRQFCLDSAHRFLQTGLLNRQGSRLTLTREGLFLSDMVTREMMRVVSDGR